MILMLAIAVFWFGLDNGLFRKSDVLTLSSVSIACCAFILTAYSSEKSLEYTRKQMIQAITGKW